MVGRAMSPLDEVAMGLWSDLVTAANELEADIGALKARPDTMNGDAVEPCKGDPPAEVCRRPPWVDVADEETQASLMAEASAIAEAALSRTAVISRLLGGEDLGNGNRTTGGHEPKFSRLPDAGQTALIKRAVENPELLWDIARRLSQTSL